MRQDGNHLPCSSSMSLRICLRKSIRLSDAVRRREKSRFLPVRAHEPPALPIPQINAVDRNTQLSLGEYDTDWPHRENIRHEYFPITLNDISENTDNHSLVDLKTLIFHSTSPPCYSHFVVAK